MIMKKLIALILCLVLAMSLVACGGEKKDDEKTPETTVALVPTESEETTPTQPAAGAVYKVTVVDEGGNPFAGIVVQLCNDTGCNPALTDENGTATYNMAEARDDYHANVTVLPEGYEYASGETEYYFDDGSMELTITLKAIA